MNSLDEIILDQDELEALRLADLLGYSQEDAAKKMNISRATFGRIVAAAREKTADGILNGKAIRINENTEDKTILCRQNRCRHCGRSWE